MHIRNTYNILERNGTIVKIIGFDPRQLFDPCQKFTILHHPSHPHQKFKNPRHSRHLCQNLTHSTHAI